MKTYIVNGQPVRAETERHAVKYYHCVLNRVPAEVELENGKVRDVFAVCENTGLGIFTDDDSPENYEFDSEGIHWLSDAEMQRLSIDNLLRTPVSSEEMWALYQDVLNCGMGDPWDGEELENGYVRPIPEGFEKEVEKFDEAHAASINRINACLAKIRDMGVRLRNAENETDKELRGAGASQQS